MKKDITILFSGDFAPIVKNVNTKPDFFAEVRTTLADCDLHVTNLECPLTNSQDSIEKTGPLLKTDQRNISFLMNAAVNIACLANNHIFDYGISGLKDTINVCEQYGIDTIGIVQRTDKKPAWIIKQIRDKKIGFINYCENEFSVRESLEMGANGYNPVKSYYEIISLRPKVDFLIVLFHGGNEYYPLPRPGLKEDFHFFADLGVDVVIGHHTHCFSGFEIYNGKILIYGLGNFFFPSVNEPDISYIGLLCRLEIGESINFQLIPVETDRTYSTIRLSCSSKNILERIESLSAIIKNDKELYDKWDIHCRKHTYEYMKMVFNFGIIHKFLLKVGLFKKPIFPKSKIKRILHLIHCQSHQEMILRILKTYYIKF